MSTALDQMALEAAALRNEVERVSPLRLSIDSLSQPIIRFDAARRECVSEETLRRNNVIAGLEDDERANAFRVLRVRVLQKMLEEGWSALGMTSAVAGDGKTLMAANLAVSIALDMNQSVLLVDLDLKRPAIHEAFGLNPKRGLSDYLVNECELEECLIDPGIERLVILPQAGSLNNSSEILAMPKTRQLMAALRGRNQDRLVIYDMPPLLYSDDALVVLPGLDASVLVVQEGKTEETDIERALDLLGGHNWMGTVLNRCRRGAGHH
jgi:capsular exopolysaccharide synthesis family protein